MRGTRSIARASMKERLKKLEAQNRQIKENTRQFLGLAEQRYGIMRKKAKAWKELARRLKYGETQATQTQEPESGVPPVQTSQTPETPEGPEAGR